jgi:predicted  nucleic acid-binding Zn-ribbon protein
MNMQETIQVLLGLQDLDTKIHSVKGELKRLPEERTKRRASLDGRIVTQTELETAMKLLSIRVKEVDNDTTISRQRVRKLEKAMDETGDQALIMAYQHELRSLKRDISQAEEEGLEFVTKGESFKEKRDEIATALEADEMVFLEFEENMETELAAAEKKLKVLEADRSKRMKGNLDPNVISVYERLLISREGIALSNLEGRTCQCCWMEVPANLSVRIARAVDLVTCPSCDRILYSATYN